MTDPGLGKIDPEFFEREIAPRLGAPRDDVALGPTAGVDFGVLDVGGEALVTATDPLSIIPELGFETAARFALDVVLADVAVSGVSPSHLAVCFTLPPEMTDDDFATVWRAMDAHLSDLGVSVLTGHTARYDGIDFPWVGAATAFGVGDHDDVIRPDGARPGDRLVVSTGPGAEVAGLFSTLFGDRLGLDAETLATARERMADVGAVGDAAAATAAGEIHGMHDATEGGVQGALVEMADGAGVRFEVDATRMPLAPGVGAVCDAIDVNPWHVTSSGTLVVAVAPEDADSVVDALQSRGTTASVVGTVTDGEGVTVDGERVSHPRTDPSWAAFAALAGEDGES
jgi:hydrogenase expression/formation protein HypE